MSVDQSGLCCLDADYNHPETQAWLKLWLKIQELEAAAFMEVQQAFDTVKNVLAWVTGAPVLTFILWNISKWKSFMKNRIKR